MDPTDPLLRSQLEYYRARAGEYDNWFFRRGRYDRGPEHNAAWFREVEVVAGAVDAWIPMGHVLELAAGTGLWTERLAAHAHHVTAVDASPEALRLNRKRLESARSVSRVTYLETDLFNWEPEDTYDGVFFAFWLSHVPPERFAGFWQRVQQALKPGNAAFLVDSRYTPASTARDHQLEGENATSVLRRLEDGREYRIVKVFYRADDLNAELARSGWNPGIQETETYFVYGAIRAGDY